MSEEKFLSNLETFLDENECTIESSNGKIQFCLEEVTFLDFDEKITPEGAAKKRKELLVQNFEDLSEEIRGLFGSIISLRKCVSSGDFDWHGGIQEMCPPNYKWEFIAGSLTRGFWVSEKNHNFLLSMKQ